MKIAIGSDHAGYAVKEALKIHLEAQGHEFLDCGTNSEDSVDYPEFGKTTAQKVVSEDIFGIVVCGSGIGISIAANKVEGARCALCTSPEMAKLARQHNDANIVAIGARITNLEIVKEIVDAFFSTEFEGGRHQRRVDQLG